MLEIWGKHETGWGTKWDKFTKFPASELDIDDSHLEGIEIHTAKLTINPNNPAELSEDIVKLAMLNNLNDQGVSALILPYIPGARADKAPFRGARAYAELITRNIRATAKIVVLDPHSVAAKSLYFPVSVVETAPIIQEAVDQFTEYKYDAVIAPDKGAVVRAGQYANLTDTPLYCAEKTRNPHTGKLTDYDISPFADLLKEGGTYLVVDDICDGGGTFKSLADAIHEHRMVHSLDLWVTHGLFTGLASELPIYYDQIMTTNSVVPAQDIGQHVLNIDHIFWKEIATNV